MKRRFITSVLTTALALCISAWAAADETIRGEGRHRDPAAVFPVLDSDGNGRLSKDEFKKLVTLGQGKFKDRPEVFERLFEQLDADRSGALSQGEFSGLSKLRRGSPAPEPSSSPAPPPAAASSVSPSPGAKDYAHAIEQTPLKIATVPELVLHDAKRNKDLRVRINHPQDGGPFPVIVFSHGAWGSKDGHTMLTELWASHGYVTIQPDHADSRALGVKVGDTTVFRDWQQRPADVSFILDSLAEIEAKVPALKGKLDAKHIGMSGHSYGANTAQLVGGAMAYLGDREKSLADPRVTAVALLSGQGPGEMLTEKSWANFTKPFLVMTGSRDGPTRTGQPAVWRKKPYELSPPGDKYLVWVEGMDHGFGGLSGLKDGLFKFQRNEDHIRYTKMVTLAFWDAFLKGDAKAKAWLASDALATVSKGQATIINK